MLYKNVRLISIVVAFIATFSNSFSQLQMKQLPIEVTCRKSLLGGSYVLQIRNISTSPLKIWLDAREKVTTYLIPAGKMKEIGWAQGFRFDANDIFFIGADGFNTIKQTMPSDELSAIRLGFSKDGAFTINLSQSFLQNEFNKNSKLPIKEKVPRVLDLELNEFPQIILQDRANRIYANLVFQIFIFSGKIHIPIKTTVSFVPSYISTTGTIMASQINVDNININGLPPEWFNQVTNIVNQLIPIWFSRVQLFQLDKTMLKYCKFFNVRQISIHNRRLVIELL